jgi:hypothetical protein
VSATIDEATKGSSNTTIYAINLQETSKANRTTTEGSPTILVVTIGTILTRTINITNSIKIGTETMGTNKSTNLAQETIGNTDMCTSIATTNIIDDTIHAQILPKQQTTGQVVNQKSFCVILQEKLTKRFNTMKK